jgi:hypothetical protein
MAFQLLCDTLTAGDVNDERSLKDPKDLGRTARPSLVGDFQLSIVSAQRFKTARLRSQQSEREDWYSYKAKNLF